MKKFNNTLEGTDCGDAGLSTPCRNTVASDRGVRATPTRSEHGATVLQFPRRRANPMQPQEAEGPGRSNREIR